MKHLKLLFALGILLFFSCQTVSARGVRIPFGDREVLNKVADLPDTDDYKIDEGNYIDLATLHQEFNIAYILPLYIEKEPRLTLKPKALPRRARGKNRTCPVPSCSI